MKKFAEYLSEPGFRADEMAGVLEFHEQTKVRPYSSLARNIITASYVSSERGAQEASRNYNVFLSGSTESLPVPGLERFDPLSVADVVQTRYSCRDFDEERESEPARIRACLRACCETRTAIAKTDGRTRLSFRGYPSPGGLYPVEIYLLERSESEWNLFHLESRHCKLRKLKTFDDPERLADAACLTNRELIYDAHGAIIFGVVWERVVVKYGYQGYRFALTEVGIAAHHASFILSSIGVDNLHWASYYDDRMGELLGLDPKTESVGHLLWYGNARQREAVP